jgi:hypothetical protein
MKMDYPPRENDNKAGKSVDKKSFLKRALMIGLASLTLSTVGKAQSSENLKNATPKDIAKITSIKANLDKNFTEESPFELWTKGKTTAGETTPTGLNNSFLNNKYEIKPGDISVVAKYFGLDASSAGRFQSTMYSLLEEKYPDLIEKIKKEYNLPAAGTFRDKLVGVRDAFAISLLKEKIGGDETSVSKTQDEEKPILKIEKEDERIFKLEGFDKLYVFFDVSPSMRLSKDTLAKDLLKNKFSIPVEFYGFTNKVEYENKAKNLEEASMILRNTELRDVDQEYAVNVLLEKIEKMEKEGRKLIVICTDEELQNVSKEELLRIKELSIEKNAEIQFTVMLRGEIHNLGVDEIIKIYEEKNETKVREDVERYNKLIVLRERYINEYKASLEKTSDKKEIKNLKENLKNEEKELLELKVGLINAKQVNIRDFQPIQKDIARNK